MSGPLVLLLASAAGAMQALGYLRYLHLALKGETQPNPVSAIMFAYGTGLLTVFEAAAGVAPAVLILPLVCTAFAVLEALLVAKHLRREAPDRIATLAFVVDLALSALYLAIWITQRAGSASIRIDPLLASAFLLCVNATTVTSFVPLVRSTFRDPGRERPGPWIAWAVAYALLLVATLLGDGITHPSLLVYPATNLVLHAALAGLTLRPTSRA